MASTQQLKSRIRSVKSTKQITKAMQMVAASKMRKSQDATKASAPYTRTASEILAFLAGQGVTDEHPLYMRRKIKTRLIILIAADKGLAGAYNANVFKKYLELLRRDDERGIKNLTIAAGRKAAYFVSRLKDTEVIGVHEDIPDHPDNVMFRSALTNIVEMYESGQVDAVTIVYTEFISSMKQEATWLRLLPAGTNLMSDPSELSNDAVEAKFEPSADAVLDAVTLRLISAKIFQAFLDARASEHSMRMLAMKNATDNATELAADLTLEMNKARQAAITQELAEISGGAEAMK